MKKPLSKGGKSILSLEICYNGSSVQGGNA